MKYILTAILFTSLGYIFCYLLLKENQTYKPEIIHDTINKRVDSIIKVENTIYKTIEKTKIIYAHKKDSIIHLPDSIQFDLFRANCERYDYLLSDDSAIASF